MLVLSFVMPAMVGRIGDSVSRSVHAVRTLPKNPEPADAVSRLSDALQDAFLATLPLLLVVAATALVTNIAQVGLVLTGRPLKPKLNRISPKAGLKRMFSAQSLWDTGKSMMRIGLLALIVIPAFSRVAGKVIEEGNLDLSKTLPALSAQVLSLVRMFAALALVLAAVDYVLARRRTNRQVRMTKAEVKQEYRNTEGDPHIKAKLKSLRRMFSQNRMIADAANADVLIVNPTHFAVAIKYDRAVGVPVVVARGRDNVAMRIRESAQEASVPIVEEKPLARALYWATEVGETIPREMFEAVARVLAFVYSLKGNVPRRGVLHLPTPLRAEIPEDAQGPGARLRSRADARRARVSERAAARADRSNRTSAEPEAGEEA